MMRKGSNLFEDEDLVGLLQVLELVGDEDARLPPQQAANAPDGLTIGGGVENNR